MNRPIRNVTISCLAAALCIPACADDIAGPCETPAGTYTVEVAYVSGDCGNDLVAFVLGAFPRDTVLGPGACGFYEATDRSTSDGCAVAMEIVATATAAGLADGALTVEVDCENGFSCSAFFNAYWTLRSSR